jgi:hypothetical protein
MATLLLKVYGYVLSAEEIMRNYRTERMLFMSKWWILRNYLRLTWCILIGKETWRFLSNRKDWYGYD